MIYLDYNATAPVRPDVMTAVQKGFEILGNPSSVHTFGRAARKAMEEARGVIAERIGTDPNNIIFTSGATESNNTVLNGTKAERLYISAIEHPSLTEFIEKFPDRVSVIPVTPEGIIDLDWLENALAENPDTESLISVMMVNNETGVIQPIKAVATLAKSYDNVHVHTDAVQAVGRIPVNFSQLGVDYMSMSAHKIGGPPGIGLLIYDHDTPLTKLLIGGGQEKRRRAGTENLPAAMGYATAIKAATETIAEYQALSESRDIAESMMAEAVNDVLFFGQDAPRVANTIQLSLPGIEAEKQLMNLDLAGISVSSGSACSSGSIRPSHVLKAMGASDDQAVGALRVSAGWNSDPKEFILFAERWIEIANKLKRSHAA